MLSFFVVEKKKHEKIFIGIIMSGLDFKGGGKGRGMGGDTEHGRHVSRAQRLVRIQYNMTRHMTRLHDKDEDKVRRVRPGAEA